MICYICASDMVTTKQDFEYLIDGRIIKIKNIPCYKCTKCEEVVISSDIFKELNEKKKSISKNNESGREFEF